MITPEQFEQACISLKDYFGVVGMFGGCPPLSPYFPELCEILRRHIPWKQRGLWANNLRGHGAVCRETFNPSVSNLNVHLDRDAYDEMKRDWQECKPVGLTEDSRHAPSHGSMMDLDRLPSADKTEAVENNEANRWKLIGNCMVNQRWSAMIAVVRGNLRGYFCEIAAAQAMLKERDESWPDLGHEVRPGWWNKPMAAFEDQARWHCHRCMVPVEGYGDLAIGGTTEQTTNEYADIYRPKVKGREVQVVTDLVQIGGTAGKFTDYIQNVKK